jgi:hypothetical protein
MFIRIIDGYIVYYHPVLTGAWGVKCLGSLTSDVTGCKPKNECMSSDQKTPSLSSTCIHAWFSVRFVLLDHLKIIVCPLSFLFWPLHYLSFDLRLLVTPLVPSHFWPLHYLSFDLRLLVTPLVSSHFWPLHYLSFDLRLLVTHLVSSHF